ncbi:response regulator [Glaciecola sp. MH2013]|uniref:PAS domain-containing hybrid sensor histidine kinase/response regulator n=1 Tax=Glaciecola sp. MH2013 TaxID=2785524 RepID=UPI0018A10806|nr:PAS domain-containing hybrid sensor histidine kinase/response regulator [Glaciecola sp. MH2013]MBF7072899.1 response regulator [Glaciecola sp. MH2013]
MQSYPKSSQQHTLTEKYTSTGSLTYHYDTGKTCLSQKLFDILEIERDISSSLKEWEFDCFSEHTKRLLRTRIEIGETKLEPIELKIVINTQGGNQRWLRYCCEFFEEPSQSSSHDNKLSNLGSLGTRINHRIAIIQDISDSVQSAQKNHYYQERIQLALANTQTGTWDYNLNKNELFWDDLMYRLFDSSQGRKSIKFHDWVNLISVEYRDVFIEQFNAGISCKQDAHTIDLVVRTTASNTQDKFIAVKGQCFVDELNVINRIVGTCIDVTDAEKNKNKVVELAALAQQNQRLLKEANATRERFIANVSHEVRTPMNAVIGAIQILQSYDFNDELKSVIDMANSSSHDLLNILNDVLDLARMDSTKLDVEQVDINIEKLIRDCVNSHRNDLKPDVSLTLIMEKSHCQNRLGDPVKFNQIIDNLISNAVKFTFQGEILVKVSGDSQHVTLSIEDTGIGIAESAQDTIFDAFRQEDESTTRRYGGTGLGLAIVKRLTAHMRGTISLKSRLGEGSCFKIELPLPIVAEHLNNPSLSSLKQIIPSLAGKAILVGTDNKGLNNTLSQLLSPTDASVFFDIDSPALIRRFRQQKQIEFVLLDAELPLLDTMYICNKLRSDQPAIKIMLISKEVDLNEQKLYFNAGISHIIIKPLKFDAFYKVLMQS